MDPTFIGQGAYGCLYSGPIGKPPKACKDGRTWCVTKIMRQKNAKKAVVAAELLEAYDREHRFHVPTFSTLGDLSKKDQKKFPCILASGGEKPTTLLYQDYSGVSLGKLYEFLSVVKAGAPPLKLTRSFLEAYGNILAGLAHFTEKEGRILVHGDLKLDNLLLSEELSARMIDFDFSFDYSTKTGEGESEVFWKRPPSLYMEKGNAAYTVWPPEVIFLYFAQPRQDSVSRKWLLDDEVHLYETFLRRHYFRTSTDYHRIVHPTKEEIDAFVRQSLTALKARTVFEFGTYDHRRKVFLPQGPGQPKKDWVRLHPSFLAHLLTTFDLWGFGLALQALLEKDLMIEGKFCTNVCSLDKESEKLLDPLKGFISTLHHPSIFERPSPKEALATYQRIVRHPFSPLRTLRSYLTWSMEMLYQFWAWSRTTKTQRKANNLLKPVPSQSLKAFAIDSRPTGYRPKHLRK